MLEHLDTLIAFAVVMLLLSLLITVVVQAIVSSSAMRSRHLRIGMVTLLKQIYPDLPSIEELADRVLRHPAVAHLGFKRATAIRPRELVLVLEQLAGARGGGTTTELGQEVKVAIGRSFERAAGSGSPEMIAKAQQLLSRLETELPAAAVKIREVVETTLGSTQEIVVKIDAWFETVMDRTSERFKLWTRWITAGAAFLLALGFHVDSLSILRQLSSDPELRARVAGLGADARGQAEGVLGRREAGESIHSLAIAAPAVGGAGAEGEAPAPGADGEPARLQAIRDEARRLCPGETAACAEQAITCADGRRWLASQGASAALVESFDERCGEIVATRLGQLRRETEAIRGTLEATGLQIFAPDPVARWADVWVAGDGLAVLGVLMTGAFLSLGAPFWYNALRRLSDLRPILARRVEADEDGSTKAETAQGS